MKNVLIFLALFWGSFSMAQKIWMTPNSGQWDPRIDYAVDLSQGKLYMENDGMCFYLTDVMSHQHDEEDHHSEDALYKAHVIKQKFLNSTFSTETVKKGASRHVKNYYIGNESSKWRKNHPNGGKILETSRTPF